MFKLIALGVVCLALLAAGCGGNDSTSLTKAEFIKQGDAICKETDKSQNQKIRAYLAENPKTPSTKANTEKVISVAFPQIKAEVEELAALDPPSGDEEEIEAIVAGVEEGLEEAEKNPVSTNKTGAGNPFDEVGKLARKYGFKECDFPY